MGELRHGRTCVFNINYHIVWSTKYRRKVLTPNIENRLKEILINVGKRKGFEIAEKETYYVLRKARNDEAGQKYLDILEEESDGLYIRDIIRGGIVNDDPRIPRNISE